MKFVINHSRESATYGQVYVTVIGDGDQVIFQSPMRDRVEDVIVYIDTVRGGACRAAVEERFLSGSTVIHRHATGQGLGSPYDYGAEAS